jgi:hypothetical protein
MGLSRANTRHFCSALAALVSPVQNIFFLVHYFNSYVSIAQQVGQADVLGRLAFNICLRRIQILCRKRRKLRKEIQKGKKYWNFSPEQ